MSHIRCGTGSFGHIFWGGWGLIRGSGRVKENHGWVRVV